MESKSQYSNKTKEPSKINFSNNAESNIVPNNDQYQKLNQEQQDRHTKELGTIISKMKKKMDEGSKMQSRVQSQIFYENNSRNSMNSSNSGINKNFNNNDILNSNMNFNLGTANIVNNSNQGSNYNMNMNMNNNSRQGSNYNMNMNMNMNNNSRQGSNYNMNMNMNNNMMLMMNNNNSHQGSNYNMNMNNNNMLNINNNSNHGSNYNMNINNNFGNNLMNINNQGNIMNNDMSNSKIMNNINILDVNKNTNYGNNNSKISDMDEGKLINMNNESNNTSRIMNNSKLVNMDNNFMNSNNQEMNMNINNMNNNFNDNQEMNINNMNSNFNNINNNINNFDMNNNNNMDMNFNNMNINNIMNQNQIQQGMLQNQMNNNSNIFENPMNIDNQNSSKIKQKSKIIDYPKFPSHNSINDLNEDMDLDKPLEYPMEINKTTPEEEQEKKDTLKKIEITERHSVELSKYYEYNTPEEEENGLDQLLEDINFFGELTKKEIEEQRKKNPYKYISIDEITETETGNTKYSKRSSKRYKNEYFVLSILAKALQSQGCDVVIEKDKPSTEEGNKEINTITTFLVNGMYNFKKYIFHFDFGEEENKKFLKNSKKQKYFNFALKEKLLSLFNLRKNDIIMTNPRLGSYSITAIIKQSKFNELSKEQLKQELLNDKKFCKIKEIEFNILLSGCRLNPYMLDSKGNNKDGGWGINEKRGGKPYYPPKGWIGYGLRVLDRFDEGDNTWLDYKNISDKEWTVAYHGVGHSMGGNQLLNAINNICLNNLQTGIRQQFKDSDDFYHQGQKVGEGVYVTPKPEIMENYCGKYNCNGKNYKIAFMTRVHPEKIRCPTDQKDYWVINGTDNEIRPYRILIKEV